MNIASAPTFFAATDLVRAATPSTPSAWVSWSCSSCSPAGPRGRLLLRRAHRRHRGVGPDRRHRRRHRGSGYAIYASTKRTVDRTGITTGQFGQ